MAAGGGPSGGGPGGGGLITGKNGVVTPGADGTREDDPREDETCRQFVLPALTAGAGWGTGQIRVAYPVTRGRVREGVRFRRQDRPLVADYVLDYSEGLPVAVIEAKRSRRPEDGVGAAARRAELLDVPFAYATDGERILEFNARTGNVGEIPEFPSPPRLWDRYMRERRLAGAAHARVASAPLGAGSRDWDGTATRPRYYQHAAVNRAVQAIARGQRRVLLVLAAGAGKTLVAAQVIAKLSNADWPGRRKPRVLYLAGSPILAEQALGCLNPMFGAAVRRPDGPASEDDQAVYVTAAADGDTGAGLDERFGRDFFDLVIADEFHGDATGDGARWPKVLEFFASAVHVGLTATPVTGKDADVYRHFGDPLYEYSLARGIEDGFLAACRVRRVRMSAAADGRLPRPGTAERALATLERTEDAARYVTDYLSRTGRMSKTIVFCEDDGHAARVTEALLDANGDLVRRYGPSYVRCLTATADGRRPEGLDEFRRAGSDGPVIAVTARLLSAGIDIPDVRNIVLFRIIRSMPEFKQIIGRGTRLFPAAEKLSFGVVDFTGATVTFGDPAFDGIPTRLLRDETDPAGRITDTITDDPVPAARVTEPPASYRKERGGTLPGFSRRSDEASPQEADSRVRAVRDRILSLRLDPHELLGQWALAATRGTLRRQLDEWRVDPGDLADWVGCPDADTIDLLLFVAWRTPVLTRAERAQRVRLRHQDFLSARGSKAEEELRAILEQYTARGPDALDLAAVRPDISELSTLIYSG